MQIVCTKADDGSLRAFAFHDDGQDVSAAYPGMVVVAVPDGTAFAFGGVVTPDLKAYAAAARYAKETAGITVGTAKVATDEASQAKISGMVGGLQLDPNLSVALKTDTGAFVTIGPDQIRKIGSAVLSYVQACFTAEAAVVADIASGKIKTMADVDATFAAVVSTFPATEPAAAAA